MTTNDTSGGKGLSAGAVGIVAAVIIGVSCVAPAYSLTGALGPVASGVAAFVPAVFLIAFVPMLITAFSYKELNSQMPDSGTSFTWTVRAFGARPGWMAAWGLLVSTVMVIASLAAVAVDFFYKAIGQLVGNESIVELTNNKLINIVTCWIFLLLAGYISFRGMEATKGFQYVLVIFQVVVMLAFAGIMLWKFAHGAAFDPTSFDLNWFNPVAAIQHAGMGAVAVAVSVTVFIFWGWDVILTMSEETEGSSKTPGIAATIAILITVSLYVILSVATIMFAGTGEEGIGLGNPEIQDNVFFYVSDEALGKLSIFVSLAILASSAASLQSTFVSPARTLLAMGFYQAVSPKFARVHPYYFTPSYATVACGLGAGIFYTVAKLLSENVLWDMIATMGILICFYYGMTSLSCLWYFRKQWFNSARDTVFKLILPALGFLIMAVLFVGSVVQSFNPDNGSGSQIGGVGLVFILAVVIFLLGIILMEYCAHGVAAKFFAGQRFLRRGLPEDGFTGVEELATPEALDAEIR